MISFYSFDYTTVAILSLETSLSWGTWFWTCLHPTIFHYHSVQICTKWVSIHAILLVQGRGSICILFPKAMRTGKTPVRLPKVIESSWFSAQLFNNELRLHSIDRSYRYLLCKTGGMIRSFTSSSATSSGGYLLLNTIFLLSLKMLYYRLLLKVYYIWSNSFQSMYLRLLPIIS